MRDPFNQNFWKFRYKTQWIGSVQPEKFRKNWSTLKGGSLNFIWLPQVLLRGENDSKQSDEIQAKKVDHFSRSDRSEFWLNGSQPSTPPHYLSDRKRKANPFEIMPGSGSQLITTLRSRNKINKLHCTLITIQWIQFLARITTVYLRAIQFACCTKWIGIKHGFIMHKRHRQ